MGNGASTRATFGVTVRGVQSLVLACLWGLLAMAYPAHAALEGSVRVVPGGMPLKQAAVILSQPAGAASASVVTVFTDGDGRFRFPGDVDVGTAGATLEIGKLGYRIRGTPDRKLRVEARASAQPNGIAIEVEPVSNIAETAPASAWLRDWPESDTKHLLNLQCSGCHQFPSVKVREYARLLEEEKAPDGIDAKAVEAWRKEVRLESWRAMLKFMRAKMWTTFPDKSSIKLENVPWSVVQSNAISIWTDKQADVIARYLAEHFPTDTSVMTSDQYSPGAPLGVTTKTVIREYALPDTSFVREAIMVKNSPYIWGADFQKNRLLRLDPRNNQQKWYPVPFAGATGPHTLVGDADGNVWVSMIMNDKLGRYNPNDRSWKLWTMAPSNVKSNGMGIGQWAVHDIAFGPDGKLARDPSRRIWLTLIGANKMGAFDPDTGDLKVYDAPAVPGMTAANISIYGTILSAHGSCAWFAQLNGYFGCMNTKTFKPESLVSFSEGAGPRRIAVEADDTVWIPLFGSGQIVKYDGRNRRILATYDLPDRRAAPYAVTWDERRKVLWVTTTNADVLYRFDPQTRSFTVYPLPRRQAYLRQINVDPNSGRLISSYSNVPTGSGPSMVVMIDVGDSKASGTDVHPYSGGNR